MPVEQIRKRFAGDLALYPNLASERVRDEQKKDSRSSGRDIISVASTASSSSGRTSIASSSSTTTASSISPAKSNARPIVISSDEESDSSDVVEVEHQLITNHATDPKSRPKIQFPEPDIRPDTNYARERVALEGPTPETKPTAIQVPYNKHPQPPPPARPPMQAYNGSRQKYESTDYPGYKPMPTPIHVPSNNDLPAPIRPAIPPHDGVAEPVINMAAGDADKAVKDLITGSIVDIEADINPEDMIVPSFAENIKLLPHQALGRIWMRDRETGKKTGGILADDMGLGKTIQTLTRIVEGRARKADAAEGWSASTLVVCPLALVGQWADEIQKMAPGFSVLKHHGNNRTANPSDFKHHVVVTTYDIVKHEYEAYKDSAKNESQATLDSDDESGDNYAKSKSRAKPAGKGKKKKAALFATNWWRVVLDEAHNIKNVKTKGAIACCELQAKFRWCLTGTPLQNNVQELYSLFKFLRIKPLNDAQAFDVQIGKPLTTGRNAGQALKKLRAVLTQVMLRRTKDQTLNGEKIIELPARNVNVISCDFDSAEQEFYTALETKMGAVLQKLMASDTGNKAYMSVLLLLLRLRQACNHPVLVTKDFKGDSEAIEPKGVKKGASDQDGDADDLVAAFDQLGVTRKCRLCMEVLLPTNTGEGEWSSHCLGCIPLARGAKRNEHDIPSSAKLRKILEILGDIKEKSNGSEKTIIFSQFTSMLDLIEPFLKDESIRYVRYDGKMKPADREASLKKIKEDPKTRVILISFKAGSTGLNLTACNNVILVDLWWNPALEDQAFDRAHRFGQTRDVNIFKLKIDNTIEDRILQLQEKKRMLAQAALAGTKLKDMRLGFDELLALLKWDRDAGDGGDDDSDGDEYD